MGYECRRVFPTGVVRFGWLRMVFTRCASFELQFDALRGEVVACERQGDIVVESLARRSSTRKRTMARSIG